MTFASDQAQTARELGYGEDVRAMNREHDLIHLDLCTWLRIPSLAIQQAAGRRLSQEDAGLAAIEEDAVLAVQRLIRAHGAPLPRDPR